MNTTTRHREQQLRPQSETMESAVWCEQNMTQKLFLLRRLIIRPGIRCKYSMHCLYFTQILIATITVFSCFVPVTLRSTYICPCALYVPVTCSANPADYIQFDLLTVGRRRSYTHTQQIICFICTFPGDVLFATQTAPTTN